MGGSVDLVFAGPEPADIQRGQTLQTKLTLGDPTPALLIPNGAFYNETGGSWVFVVTPDGDEAVKRQVAEMDFAPTFQMGHPVAFEFAERLAQVAPQGFSLATDIAEWLVREGVPFRIAHEGARPRVCILEQDELGLSREAVKRQRILAGKLEHCGIQPRLCPCKAADRPLARCGED